MKQIVTEGIVLARTDYQEADRILTVLTPSHGKLRFMAKGVRRPKSKLAGGIELFSTNELTYIEGRSDIKTLVSARMAQHYGDIIRDLQRTMLGYDLLKRINRLTEDTAGEEYYGALHGALAGLNDLALPMPLVELWFMTQVLNISGRMPDVLQDADGHKLAVDAAYNFDFDAMAFRPHDPGQYTANHIKLLRICLVSDNILALRQLRFEADQPAQTLLLVREIDGWHN